MSGPPPIAARVHLIVATLVIGAWPALALGQGLNSGGTQQRDALDRIEFHLGYWRPATVIHAAGEAGGIPGTPIDFRSDFGLVDRGFPQLQLAAHVGTRHELSFGYVPIRFETQAVLRHDVTFAGSVYPEGSQTQGTVSWNAIRFGYTYDVVVTPRVSVGVVAEIDRTDVKVRLQNSATTTSTSASVPTIPAAGAVIGVRVTNRLTLSAEASGIYVPDRKDQVYGGHYLNAESHATWALRRHVGADLGFRLIDIRHLGEADSGTLRLHGLTLGVLVGH